MNHVPGPGNDLHPLLIPGLLPLKWHEQHNPVPHDRTCDTVKVILYQFPELGVILVQPDIGPHRVGHQTVHHPIAKFQDNGKPIPGFYVQHLQIIIAVYIRVIPEQVIDKTALNHGYHQFQLFPYLQVIAELLPGLLHLMHGADAHIQYLLFVHRLCDELHHPQVDGLLGIGKFVIGRNDDEHHG